MMKRLSLRVMGTGVMALSLAQSQSSTKQTNQPSTQHSSAALDRMIAAGKSQRELAGYVFDTHGCKTCHTLGHDGKLGYTAAGKQKTKGFEGCISMLTAMSVIAQVPEDQRRPEQRQKAERFEEFGCTTCHKVTPGKLELTEAGTKLAHLHLGCVDVEKLLSSRTGAQN